MSECIGEESGGLDSSVTEDLGRTAADRPGGLPSGRNSVWSEGKLVWCTRFIHSMYLTNSQTNISQLLASLPTELGGSPARSPKSGDHTCHGTPQTNRYVQVRCFSFFAMLYSMYLTNLRVFFMQRKATNIKTHKVSSYLNIADASFHPNSFPTSSLTPHFYLRL